MTTVKLVECKFCTKLCVNNKLRFIPTNELFFPALSKKVKIQIQGHTENLKKFITPPIVFYDGNYFFESPMTGPEGNYLSISNYDICSLDEDYNYSMEEKYGAFKDAGEIFVFLR